MATIFGRIIEGEIPGRFVWKDDHCVGLVDINPLHVGHTLVIPRVEVDHWLDLHPALSTHCFTVARRIGEAQMRVFRPARIGLIIAGFEVPHAHLHVIPVDSMADLEFANADRNPDPAALDDTCARLAAELRAAGHAEADL
jgi:diadenosine tetraphosphate (Ap4A) HIT family hydrolase